MSKSFEEEYRQMMAEQAPDLWDRIEAKLPEKIPVDVEADHTDGFGDQIVRRKVWRRTAIAAGISALVLAAGVVAVVTRDGRQSSEGMTDMMDMAAADAPFEDMPEDMSDDMDVSDSVAEYADDMMDAGRSSDGKDTWSGSAADGIAEDETYWEEADTADGLKDAVTQTASETDGKNAQEAANGQTSQEAAVQKADGTEQAVAGSKQDGKQDPAKRAQNSAASVLETESVWYSLTIQVTSVENTGEEIVYHAKVLEASGQDVREGNSILFSISDDEIEPPFEGQIYTVTLEDTSPGLATQHPYILREIMEQGAVSR